MSKSKMNFKSFILIELGKVNNYIFIALMLTKEELR